MSIRRMRSLSLPTLPLPLYRLSEHTLQPAPPTLSSIRTHCIRPSPGIPILFSLACNYLDPSKRLVDLLRDGPPSTLELPFLLLVLVRDRSDRRHLHHSQTVNRRPLPARHNKRSTAPSHFHRRCIRSRSINFSHQHPLSILRVRHSQRHSTLKTPSTNIQRMYNPLVVLHRAGSLPCQGHASADDVQLWKLTTTAVPTVKASSASHSIS